MVASPTQRTLQRCRKLGMTATVVEHWNSFARIRQDMFGCIDIVALKEDAIVGIQATSTPNIRARIKKATQLPALRAWLKAGGRFEVWGWKKNDRGRYDLTIVDINEEYLPKKTDGEDS